MAQFTVPRARKLVVAMKAEGTAGTDIFAGTYTAGDIVPAFNVAPDLRMDEIQNLSMAGDIGRLPSVMGIESGTIAFSMYARGFGSAYSSANKPEVDRPLTACAFPGTGSFASGAEKWTYQPGTPQTFSIYAIQENGRTLKLVGCLGTFDVTMRAGGVSEFRFTFNGKVGGVADVTYVAGSVGGTPQYPVFKSAAFQIGTGNYAPRIANVSLALGNVISPIPSINDITGMAGYFISDRNPRVTIDPEADTVANFDWYTAMKNGTLHDMGFQAGTAAYNRMKFQFSASLGNNIQVVSTTFGSRDGMTSSPASLLATISAGSDDLSLLFD